MTKKRTRAPAKQPAPKLSAKEPAATPDQETPSPTAEVLPEPTVLVAQLSQNAFQLIMQIIDNANFKGSEAGQVLAVKLELARVAGLRTAGDGQ